MLWGITYLINLSYGELVEVYSYPDLRILAAIFLPCGAGVPQHDEKLYYACQDIGRVQHMNWIAIYPVKTDQLDKYSPLPLN